MATSEIWKEVPGYEGLYEVSNLGSVRSLDRTKKTRWEGKEVPIKGVIKNQTEDKDGYLRVTLCKNSKQTRRNIHKLVLAAFKGQKEKWQVSRHIDGNNQNNHVDNLFWGTQRENCQDREKHREERNEPHPLIGRTFSKEHRKNLSKAQQGPRSPRGPGKRKTHCKRGHLYTKETCYFRRNKYYGSRECKICIKLRKEMK